MKEYSEKEKFEKRFQYSIAMASILIIAGIALYDFIGQQVEEIDVQKEKYISIPNNLFIIKVLSVFLIAIDATLFMLGFTFIICVVLNGIHIAEILADKWQKKTLFTYK